MPGSVLESGYCFFIYLLELSKNPLIFRVQHHNSQVPPYRIPIYHSYNSSIWDKRRYIRHFIASLRSIRYWSMHEHVIVVSDSPEWVKPWLVILTTFCYPVDSCRNESEKVIRSYQSVRPSVRREEWGRYFFPSFFSLAIYRWRHVRRFIDRFDTLAFEGLYLND